MSYLFQLMSARIKENKEYKGLDYIESSMNFLIRATEEIARFRFSDFSEAMESFAREIEPLEEIMHVYPDDKDYFEAYRMMYLMAANSSALICMFDIMMNKIEGKGKEVDFEYYKSVIEDCFMMSKEYISSESEVITTFISLYDDMIKTKLLQDIEEIKGTIK